MPWRCPSCGQLATRGQRGAHQSTCVQARLSVLLQKLPTLHTFSDVYNPFLHGALQSGEYALDEQAWSAHDSRWAALLARCVGTESPPWPLSQALPVDLALG